LFEDAARYLDRALERAPDRYEWWIERARTAYYQQRFVEQQQFGSNALGVTGFSWLPAPEVRAALLHLPQSLKANSYP